jgi:MFS family permease
MLANPLVGILADRLFAAQRVYFVACGLCGLLLLLAGWWCQQSFPRVEQTYREAASAVTVQGRPVIELWQERQLNPAQFDEDQRQELREALQLVNDSTAVRHEGALTFRILFGIMLAQAVALQIGLTLTTVISLRNLPDPSHDFSRTRMWGTVGWVVVGWMLGLTVEIRSAEPFYLAGILALLVSGYAFSLPHTPPKGRGKSLGEAFGLPAFRLFRDRSFVVFLIVAYVASVMNQFYGVYGHKLLTDWQVQGVERWMTVGQILEVGVMFTIPLLKPKKTMKWLMLLGLLGWTLRGLALTTGSVNWALGLAVPMHGWSFAFYFIVAATYIDREAPPHLRASAQAIVAFVASGLGPWSGNMLAAWVVDHYRTGETIDWPSVWIGPTICCSLLFCGFLIWFKAPPAEATVLR